MDHSDQVGTPVIGVLEELVGYHLRRASAVFVADFVQTVGEGNMRQVLFAILAIVDASPGVNQGNVGRLLGIKRANMVSLVNELVKRKLISRKVDLEDRRAFALNLTAQGRLIIEETQVRIRSHEARLLTGFSENDRRSLIRLLRKIERLG